MSSLITVAGGNLSQSSFSQRLLQAQIIPAQNTGVAQPSAFAGATGGAGLLVNGARMKAHIENSGSVANNTLTLDIYGLAATTIQQLSTMGIVFNSVQRNTIQLSAGGTGGFSLVFSGTIIWATPDYNHAPDVPFRIIAQSPAADAVVAATPASFRGSTSVSTIMSGLARAMNVGFENNGVTAQVMNPYYPGNIWTQIQELARHAHIVAQLVDGGVTLAIWPVGGNRSSQSVVPLVSLSTGMIGTPTFSQNGYMIIRMLFNPLVSFGATIQVQSAVIPQANGVWTVQKLDLDLDTLVPNGNWMGTVYGYPVGYGTPTPPQA